MIKKVLNKIQSTGRMSGEERWKKSLGGRIH
jgi:hypothetical protein